MRDAYNYFVCLNELKDLRGHREQPKTRRTASSFRLWGDPELPLFPQPTAQPAIAPISASWTGSGRLTVDTPAAILPEARNEEYAGRIFPGAELAGIVSKPESGPIRHLLSLYFFRLPLPADFESSGYASLRRHGERSDRGVFRVDPSKRFLYVLYLPEQEQGNSSFTLQWARRPPVQKPPLK
jgi:hypothetical protein